MIQAKVNDYPALKPGTNKLEIKAINTWVNRLTDDHMLPIDQRQQQYCLDLI